MERQLSILKFANGIAVYIDGIYVGQVYDCSDPSDILDIANIEYRYIYEPDLADPPETVEYETGQQMEHFEDD